MYKVLKPGGRIVLEFGAKGNVQTIINQLRASLYSRGYLWQSKLIPWYFPSVEEYSKELKLEGFKVDIAKYFERPTELSDENKGIIDWLTMFGEVFFDGVLPNHGEEIKKEVQEKVKDKCLKNGKWFADYKRLRILAFK